MLALKNNPPSGYPERTIIESQSFWWIAKVKPRQEKVFAFDLLEQEIEFYLPYFTKVTRRKDNGKVRKSLLPLFPSYVPFNCAIKPWKLLQQKIVVTILEIKNQEKFKKELNNIYIVNEMGFPLSPIQDNSMCPIGTEVRITTGPCAGLSGKVLKLKDYSSFILRVDGLGEACVTVTNDVIEKDC